MLVPELAYQFTVPRDVASGSLQMVHRHRVASGASTAVFDEVYFVPSDSILILSHINTQAIAGAAQIPTIVQVDYLMPSGQLMVLIENRYWPAGQAGFDQNRSYQWAGQIWLPGGKDGNGRLRIGTSFDAGAAANQQNTTFFGLLIPKANAQLA